MAHDFIQVEDGVVEASLCQRLVRLLYEHASLAPGRTGGGVDLSIKRSVDVNLSHHEELRGLERELKRAMAGSLLRYLRVYPRLFLGPLTLRTGDGALLDEQAVGRMENAELEAVVNRVLRFDILNLQRYPSDQGGYPHWHSEVYPQPGTTDALHRVLFVLAYLNSPPHEQSGGATRFLYQRRAVEPRAGRVLIAPAGFTHTHRGDTPQGWDKCVAATWVCFQPAQRLYGFEPSATSAS